VEEDGFAVIESLAILDYLEASYPTPSLLPVDSRTIATVRMAEMVTVNEFAPATFPLMLKEFGLEAESPKLEQARQKIATALQFFEQHLRHSHSFYVGNSLTLADIVVGTALPLLPRLNYSLQSYPAIDRWLAQLMQRPSWQQTEPTTEEIVAFQAKLQRLFRSA
jgi:glutathione S-transferase